MKIRVMAGYIDETFERGDEAFGVFRTEADEVRDLTVEYVAQLLKLSRRDVLRTFGPGHRNVIVLNRIGAEVQVAVVTEDEVRDGTIPDRKQ